MSYQEFTVYVASVSDVQLPHGSMRYAECLYDLDVQKLHKTIIPLGYIIETSLIDGTVVGCLLRSYISEYELSLVANLAKPLMGDGMYLNIVVEQLADSCPALSNHEKGSLLVDTIERSGESALCVRSLQEVPQAVLQLSAFRPDMTRKEFQKCLPVILQAFKGLPFLAGGTISGAERKFIFAVP